MFTIPVGDIGGFLSLGVDQKTDFESGIQKKNRAGVLQWTVSVFSLKYRESLSVTVSLPEKPSVPPDGHPIELVGLEAGTYATAKGSAFYFSAVGVKAVMSRA